MVLESGIIKRLQLTNNLKHYERWATANDFPVENIINDGTTCTENAMGAGLRDTIKQNTLNFFHAVSY